MSLISTATRVLHADVHLQYGKSPVENLLKLQKVWRSFLIINHEYAIVWFFGEVILESACIHRIPITEYFKKLNGAILTWASIQRPNIH